MGLRVRVALVTVVLAAGLAGASIEEDVRFLSSAEMEGRLTGSPGEGLAADYLVKQLEELGAVPLPGREFRHSFDFTAGTKDLGSTLDVTAGESGEPRSWTGQEHVRALSFSDSGTVSGSVVFAGYGLTVPESREFSYDSYFGLDVKDKIVLVLRYSPEDAEDEVRAELTRYSGLRYKALQARDRGAKALLVVTGPNSPHAGETIPASFDAALSGSGIVAASISGAAAEAILSGVEGGLARAQTSLDTANPHVTGFEIEGVELRLEVKVERERRTGRNVIAYLPAQGVETELAEHNVVLGAHYDHLGRGRHGNSRAGKEEEGQVHHGADDNASGVAAVLGIARRLAEKPARQGIVLAFWSGEELGLLGSSAFVNGAMLPAERMSAYLNFDMVGRMRENRVNLQGVGSSEVWPRLIEQSNVVAGLDVRTQDDPYLPTDASVFYQAGVPVASFFTGNHDDYHRPTDVAEAVNYEGLEQIVGFAALLTSKLARLEQGPEYAKVERRTESTGSRDAVRAYTGTIPDYATEVEGLRLSGVADGGPADKAGIRAGDVIVEFAGRKIANIYDYTYALDAVKIDQTVEVVCLRDGERLEFTITPTARP